MNKSGAPKFSTKIIGVICFFLFVLIIFISNNHYFVPAKVVIETMAPTVAQAAFSWDTGAGFNEREKVTFRAYAPAPLKNITHTVEIARTGDRSSNAEGIEVWVDSIMFNGQQKIDLPGLTLPGKRIFNDNNKLAIVTSNEPLILKEQFERIEIVFLAHKWAGKVRVGVDGDAQILDLYSKETKLRGITVEKADPANSSIQEIPLPQIPIRAFSLKFSDERVILKKVSVESANGTRSVVMLPVDSTQYVVDNLSLGRERFHPILIIVQILFALMLTWLLYEVWTYFAALRVNSIRQGLLIVFAENDRKVFWLLLTSSLMVFSLWLLGQWPAILSVDSYHFTWREIKTFEFQNVTPWMYNFYVLALTQLYDSPAIISAFQVFYTSLLASFIFFYAYRHGAPRKIIWLCQGLFIFSIPVGMYTVTIWKDIPFNTLMLFWGWMLFDLYYRKKYVGKTVELQFIRILLLAGSLIGLGSMRHNGIIFLGFIPFILWYFKLFASRTLHRFLLTVAILQAVVFFANPYIAKTDPDQIKTFFDISYRAGPLAAIYSSNVYYSPTPVRDKEIVGKWLSEEELKKKYTPVTQAADMNLFISRWQALSSDDKTYMNHLYFFRSVQNFHLFLGDRVTMFFGSLGFSSNVFVYANEMLNTEDTSIWRPIEGYRFVPKPKSQLLFEAEKFVIKAANSFRGEVPISPFIFNTFPAMLLLIGIGSLYYKYPASALYSSLFLFNLPFIFIVLSTCEWRYMYFLLLAAYFIVPLVAVEHATRK